MFLDEELELIYNKESNQNERHFKLWEACANRISESEKRNAEMFVKSIKRIESAWRLFAQRHADIRVNGYREVFLNNVISDEGLRNKMKNLLGW